jgi:Tripartite tricarboxylate transporter TctB family
MKLLRSGQVLFALLFVVLFAILIVSATGYNPTARIMPLIVAIPVFFGAIANLVVDVRAVQRGEKPAKVKSRAPVPTMVAQEQVAAPALKMAPAMSVSAAVMPAQIPVPAEGSKPEKKKEKLTGAERTKRELIGIAWLIGYVAALILFGFNLATLGYLLAFIKFYSHESWKLTILYTVILWAFVYVAFVVLLKSSLPPGMVLDWLQR